MDIEKLAEILVTDEELADIPTIYVLQGIKSHLMGTLQFPMVGK